MIKIVKNKRFGRCLVSIKNIKKGTLIEVSELIIVPKKSEVALVEKTILDCYVYAFGKNGIAIALGNGSLFNHSKDPNVKYVFKNNKLYFTTIKDVKKNEQFFIDYGYSV